MTTGYHLTDDLAAYAMGALDPEERGALEAHLAECAECRADLADYRHLSTILAQDRAGVEPPASTWAAIAAQLRTAQAQPAAEPMPISAAPTAARAADRKPWFAHARLLVVGWAATAAVLALLAGFVVWHQFIGGNDSGVSALASAEGGSVIPLAGQNADGSPMSGRLYISEDGKEGGLAVIGMPVLEPGATYEIWFVRHDQSRAPGGLFVADARGSALVKVDIPGPLDQFEGVGITREPAGGSATATGRDLLAGPVYEK
jgi:anti-sigma-K factor RskA